MTFSFTLIALTTLLLSQASWSVEYQNQTAPPESNRTAAQTPKKNDNSAPQAVSTPANTASGKPIQYPIAQPVVIRKAHPTLNPALPAVNPSQFFPATAYHQRSEIADGGTGGDFSRGSPGVSNALEISGSAGNQGSEDMKFVNGCTSAPGKFQTVYGEVGKKGCDQKLKMSETLANFMDMNLTRCVKQAAGISLSVEGGKIYHAGVIGDAKHQKTGSLHNLGLAIDIKGIEVGGTVYNYANKDAGTEAFFSKFRECWGKAANSERLGCLTSNGRGKAPGTIGEEDKKHTEHLHLSVPLCPQVAAARGLYIAVLNLLLGQEAHADEKGTTPAIGPKSKFSTKNIPLGQFGEARLKIEDTGGEPVDADILLSLAVKCKGQEKFTELESNLPSCEFTNAKFDESTRTLTLGFKRSVLVEGELACAKPEKKSYKIDCRAALK